MQEVVSSSEIANMLGNVDVYGTARDITENTGYEFSQSFLHSEAESFDYIANEFAK